ncbi:hypothetical protein ASPWEDRAFT_168875 [Aspergillus wentii DTO 134E9]|uniref:Uncharacterized protein n=1 Tax=Aspergillus wentii DTO 134E9 TaxID=1073089 RepID=A0A1L9RVN0_ASPWE|nr:uncharacterized protein ASPWEDRAFT_168875 [Aspergillus wentii DTO 134E9]KAI9929285.1 hypothetical protein MW887_001693 [Aspergillus wentii]OJJ39011.1 hypothetical protein ASPWEDRAFT_168875 [Aspergillus wentii DTO 134E9]
MIFPFVGLFVSLALWGTFFPVPGLIEPEQSFVKRLSGAMGATAMVKGVYDLAEVISSAYMDDHLHNDSVYVNLAGFESLVDHVNPLNTSTETSLSVVYPLWEEVDQRPVVNITVRDSPRRQTYLSPMACLLFALFVVFYTMGFATFMVFLWRGIVSLCAYTPGEVTEKPDRCFGGVPKVVHYLATDRALSLYEEMETLVEGSQSSELIKSGPLVTSPASSGTVALSTMQPALTVSILREVEKAISRQHRQRELAVVSELDFRTAKGQEDCTPISAADVTLTTATPDPSDVIGSDALRSPRQWALVVRRPENLASVLVLQLACALLASWERYTVSVVPDSPGGEAAEEQELEAEGGTSPASRRRKRPSQAKRKRYARRLREAQDELFEEAAQALSTARSGN